MQNNAYYNDSLSHDDSDNPHSIARQIALRVQELHKTYLQNQPEGTISLGEFYRLFFKYLHEDGTIDAAFEMLHMIAHVPANVLIDAFAEVFANTTPCEPAYVGFEPCAQELAQELANSRYAPQDVKRFLSQLQTIADSERKSLSNDFEAEHVINLMVEKFESSVGGMRLLQFDGLPLYTGSFTYTYEN